MSSDETCGVITRLGTSQSFEFFSIGSLVNTGLALQFLSKGKFKATNHRVLWNKTKRMSIPFFFEPSYDFKMNHSFLNKSLKNKSNNIFFYKFLKKSLKKFVEYQR